MQLQRKRYKTKNKELWCRKECQTCHSIFSSYISQKRKFCSQECRNKKIPWNKDKQGEQIAWNKGKKHTAIVGNKNGNWKGGTSPLNNLYSTKEKKEAFAGVKDTGVCGVCYKQTKTVFDHCHKTNIFRGWICRKCNLALGFVEDKPWILRRLAQYLENSYEETRPKVITDALYKDHGKIQ